MIYYQSGSENTVMSPNDLEYGVFSSLVKLGPRKKVLAVPPDFTTVPFKVRRYNIPYL